MAQGDKEHRMLFDMRGRRKNVVRVVYAVLAVLMGLSLFLVIGGLNIAELFNSNGSTGEAAKPYEEQAERIEVKLRKSPDDPDLLMALTRAHVNAGNARVTVEPSGSRTFSPEAIQQFQEASQTWSEYLEATDKPSAGLAQLMSPAFVSLTELSSTYPEASANIADAVEAQKILSEQRPSINAFTTLAYYTYFTGDTAAAEKARAEAKKLANGKSEREAIDKQLDEIRKQAAEYLTARKQAEKEAKAGGANGGGQNLQSGENPFGPSTGVGGLGG